METTQGFETTEGFDLLVRNAQIVRPGAEEPGTGDIAIKDGVFPRIDGTIAGSARQELDATGLLAFPGVVDAHQHWGIYNPFGEDTASESRAAAQGGVTTWITYIRTGQYYLDQGGPYADFMPLILAGSAGRSHIDYGFHIAPIQHSHIDEVESLVDDFGVFARGLDADLALVNPDHTRTVHAEDSESSQEYAQFEGYEMSAPVVRTVLRGETIFSDGRVADTPAGRYLRRPQV
jgi:dihydroorotase-like cyclic amidohydrolase